MLNRMLRRDFQLFKRGIFPALVLAALLAAVCAAVGLSAYRDAEAGAQPVTVALADGEDSVLSRLCISVVEGQSYMQKLISVVPARDGEQALAMLSSGECGAAILLPEGYLHDLMIGTPCRGRIVLSEAAAASGELVRAVARFGELLVAAGQQGVFSGERVIEAHGLGWEVHNDFLNRINPELLSFAMEVYEDGFTELPLPYAGTGVSTAAHFAACWLALLLIVCGLFFSGLCTADCRRPLLHRLYAAGVRPRQFLWGKLLYPGLFRLVLLGLLLPALHRAVPLSISPLSLLCLLVGTAAAAAMVSCVAVSFAGRGNWQGLILAGAAACMFLVGGIVPRGMLPRALTGLGDLTPLGAVRACLLPLFGGSLSPAAAAAPVYAAAAVVLCLRRLGSIPKEGGTL